MDVHEVHRQITWFLEAHGDVTYQEAATRPNCSFTTIIHIARNAGTRRGRGVRPTITPAALRALYGGKPIPTGGEHEQPEN